MEKGRKTTRMRLKADEAALVNNYRAIKEQSQSMGLDPKTVHSGWLKTKDASLYFQNPNFGDKQENIEERFDKLLSKYVFGEKRIIEQTIIKTKLACKVTITDAHVGMNPNPNGKGLFQYEYNAKIYNKSMDRVFNSISKEHSTYGKFDLILIDDLGDNEDGYNGQTTRGGHSLPQNMSNADVFETCVDAKVNLLVNIADSGMTNRIILRKCANDNHSGDLGHLVNIAVKKIINLMYDSEFVEVETLTRFMEHRIYGDHCFILTHGKDDEQMKRGLPLHLKPETINFINDYIDFYEIKSKYIHLEKGDLHQIGYQRTKKFDYRNFMSFAPPSNWVQHNFGDSYSGYSIQIVPKKSGEISHTDYFIDYKKQSR